MVVGWITISNPGVKKGRKKEKCALAPLCQVTRKSNIPAILNPLIVEWWHNFQLFLNKQTECVSIALSQLLLPRVDTEAGHWSLHRPLVSLDFNLFSQPTNLLNLFNCFFKSNLYETVFSWSLRSTQRLQLWQRWQRWEQRRLPRSGRRIPHWLANFQIALNQNLIIDWNADGGSAGGGGGGANGGGSSCPTLCQNGGSCVGRKCVCRPGYSGDSCEDGKSQKK